MTETPKLPEATPQVGIPAVGPKTGVVQSPWRTDRDYAKFNPTPEK